MLSSAVIAVRCEASAPTASRAMVECCRQVRAGPLMARARAGAGKESRSCWASCSLARVGGGGVGADRLAGLGQVLDALRVQSGGGALQEGVGGLLDAEVVGDVRLEDRPQPLGLRITQCDLVEEPAGQLGERGDVGGQRLNGAPVLDQLGARTVRVLQPLQEAGDSQSGADHQVLDGLVVFVGAPQARTKD
ncbi:hypothetical protein ACFY2J_39805 [Streptomyces collinus]|uniref:hypothetical protein n=1 Tax=Streptomyces collinus TaxID=42684 RepID=UPI0036B35482